MKKNFFISMLLVILLSMAVLPVNAAEDSLWIPMRSSKVAAETQYPLLPTYQTTADGWQCLFPVYPSDVAATTAYGSGVVYNKKLTADGFTLKLRFDDITDPSTSNYVSFALCDSANFPFWGSNGNAVHVMFQPLADGSFWFRAYVNKDGAQTKVAETKYSDAKIWDNGGNFTLSVNKTDNGYKMTVNNNVFDYAFTELPGIIPDGKFYPVFCMYSNNLPAQKMKFTVLQLGSEKLTNSTTTSSTSNSTTTNSSTTAPKTADGMQIAMVIMLSVIAATAAFKKIGHAKQR